MKSQEDRQTLRKGDNIKGNVIVDESAKIDPTAVIGPNVVIGKDVVVGPGTKIINSTIMSGTKIEGYSLIQGSIIGW